jgi:hypothetical protein
MNGLDILSVCTSIVGLWGALVSVCLWLSPTRRLRAVDDILQRVESLMGSIGGEDVFTYQLMNDLRNVEEGLLWCVNQ